MIKYLLPLIFIIGPVWSVEFEISGNVELEKRVIWNSDNSRKLMQTWDSPADFHQGYGNLKVQSTFEDSGFIDSNIFARHQSSKLIGKQYLIEPTLTFPNKIVPRSLIDLSKKRSKNEIHINKLSYQREFESFRFEIGRMFINYGHGEIFNPVNPFNHPTGLILINSFAQGNDGTRVTHFATDALTLNYFILGSKKNANNNISAPTLWISADYQLREDTQVILTGGQDLKRNKLGMEITYMGEDALVFAQSMYAKKRKNITNSEDLFKMVLGYDQQLTALWHLRFELGYQKEDKSIDALYSESLISGEQFIGLVNKYEIHPLIKLEGTVTFDPQSDFTFLLIKSIFSVMENMELTLWGSGPINTLSTSENIKQKAVCTNLGASLQYFF